MPVLNILIVEDSAADARLLLSELERGGWDLHPLRTDTAIGMSEALHRQRWDIIIADYSMPQFSGLAAMSLARQFAVGVPFILVSGTTGEETVVAAMKAGADDFLFKGDLHRLVPVVARELRDADERCLARKTEQILRKREGQLTEALRLARLGTWYLDLKNNFTDWSPEACWLLGGAPSKEVSGLDQLLGCIHADDRKVFSREFKNPNVSQISLECRIISSNAAAAFVQIRGKIVRDEEGQIQEAGGMIQDISERKLIDAELVRVKDSAEAANRAKSEFLANMSHELRTPMSAILGFADMMTQTGEHTPDYSECIQVIRRNSHHLLELINEILDLSKIEAGQMTVEEIQCDLPMLLTDVVTLMRSRAADKSLQFNVTIQGVLPRHITTDPLRLRQILVNLLGNAIKFTASGTIEIIIACKPHGASSILQIQVRDTGIGMTTEQLGRVFRPFAQGEESTTRKFGGTGLGLAISRRLARLLKGDITVASKVDHGSTFTVSIDAGSIRDTEMVAELSEASLPKANVKSQTTEPALCARILLAEDGRDNQRLLSTHLKMAGAEVTVAENGRIAADLALNESFDLILMDMQMPVMDGYSASAELRWKGVTIPIIALTAYAMSEDRNKCLATGCTDYLSKPVQRETLLKTIRHHLSQSAESVHPIASPADAEQTKTASETSHILHSTLAGYPGLATIIVEFVAGLPLQVEQLRDFLQQGDLAQLRQLVHQLRGACGGYGFDAITDIAAAAEEAIRSGESIILISARIDSLTQMIQRINGYVALQSKQAA